MRIDVTEGHVAPTPIALTAFYGQSQALASFGQQLTQVITTDLESSGLFKAIDPRAFIQNRDSLRKGPRFDSWRVLNTQLLMKGDVSRMADGRLRVEFRLFDVIREKQMEGLAFIVTEKNWRRIAHKISDAIYQRVTGETGYFDTRIVYVSQTGPANKRIKRLALMDQDGENHHYLSNGQTLVLTPRFSPAMHDIAYLDFQKRQAHVFILRLGTGQKYLLGNFPGMTFAPRFSPDGSSIVMSLAKNGATSLYAMNLVTKSVTRLTEAKGQMIDTSPCYSPDGAFIAFNTDRSGQRSQIYVMGSDGSDMQRISYGQGSYRTPVWSPRGDLIAFTKMYKGQFYIGVMKPNGEGERLIATGWLVEDPAWSPNGRVIMFTRGDRQGRSRIHTIDLTGRNEREIKTPTDAAGAAWSPLIP
jgi:TolB protein